MAASKETIKEAENLYRSGEKLVDIAHKLGVPEGTVRRWKSTYKWGSKKGERSGKEKSERSFSRSGKEKKRIKKTEAEIAAVCENEKLNDKQKLFCLYYVRYFNATKAYQKAYECSYETAAAISYRLLENIGVRNEIQRLKKNRMNRELLSEEDIFQKYMDIAFADITDFVEFGTREIKGIKYSYVNIRESASVDGTLISEVSKGKDGVKVKLADRMQALKWLSDHMDLATEEQKARIASLKAKSGADDGGNEVDDWISAVMGEDVESDG